MRENGFNLNTKGNKMEILDIQKQLIKQLYPSVWRESIFYSPVPIFHIPAETVFDAVRELSKPPMTEDEFNNILDAG